MSTEREPCPWRIIEDAGGAFAIGMFGGSIFHFASGFRNAPKGMRVAQAIGRVKARTPILSGAFAIWGLAFSGFECLIISVRKKEDPMNGIMSGFLTGGFLAARAGAKAAGKNAVVGAVLLAAIEGLGKVVGRILQPWMEEKSQTGGQPLDLLDPPADPLRPYRPPLRNMLSNAIALGTSGMGMQMEMGDTGVISGERSNNEFDFTTGRYRLEQAGATTDDSQGSVVESGTEQKKGWW
jgi:import inner membrane translocase subunit TIM17